MTRNCRNLTVDDKLEAFNWFWRKSQDQENCSIGKELVWLAKINSWIVTVMSLEACYELIEDPILASNPILASIWKQRLGKTKDEAIEKAIYLCFGCSPEELWLKMTIERG